MFGYFRELIGRIRRRIIRPLNKTEERIKEKIEQQKSLSEQYIKEKIEQQGKKLGQENKEIIQQVQESNWLRYYTIHQKRLDDIRQKVSKGKNVKVFFLVTYSAKFESKTVYDAMIKSDLFDPYIFIVHPRDRYFSEHPELFIEAQENFKLFQERGYHCILGYDKQGKPLFLESFRPDVVFYNNPNLWMWSHYNNITINANYLTCFMAYFMDSSNLLESFRFYYRCNYSPINTAWKCFEESYYSYYGITQTLKKEVHPKINLWSGANAVLSGFPKLDMYYAPENKLLIPEKIRNNKPTIIYAPHWSIRYLMKLSTFHLFGHKMIQLAKEHPEYNFVFKPHPELADHIRDLNACGVRDLSQFRGDFDMTPEEYSNYIKDWDSLPNGIYAYDGEYIELFRHSSVLITDCGSFIQEYLPSGHPCIYILTPEKDNPLDFYGDLGKKVLDSYYLCQTWAEITEYLDLLLKKQVDPKKEERKRVLAEEYVNLGHAGQFIVDYITAEIKNI